jgi:hypothetical protein
MQPGPGLYNPMKKFGTEVETYSLRPNTGRDLCMDNNNFFINTL